MSGDIGPGDKVICVDLAFSNCPNRAHHASLRHLNRPTLVTGRHYTVAAVVEGRPTGEIALKLVETDNGNPYGYCIGRFRKLNDGEDDAELIARIKGRTPTREQVSA